MIKEFTNMVTVLATLSPDQFPLLSLGLTAFVFSVFPCLEQTRILGICDAFLRRRVAALIHKILKSGKVELSDPDSSFGQKRRK